MCQSSPQADLLQDNPERFRRPHDTVEVFPVAVRLGGAIAVDKRLTRALLPPRGTSGRVRGRVEPLWCRSDGERQFIEGRLDSMLEWCVGGDFVVAASEVLDEGISCGKD